MVEKVIRENRDRVRNHPMSESWFREWSASACEFDGLQPGSDAYESCREQKVLSALETPMSAPMRGQAMSVAASVRSLAGKR